MPTLSIFVDESGDFGESSDGYYVIGLVLHEQQKDIEGDLRHLGERLREIGLENHTVHSGAAIRGEAEYRDMPYTTRKRAFTFMHAFLRRTRIQHHAISLRRREHADRLKLEGAIARELGGFLQARTSYFRGFDQVIVYYDNGQAELTRILNAVMNAYFLQVEFRRMQPADYRLFQAADLVCTLGLLEAKDNDNALSRSDLFFFESARKLRKDYLKPIQGQRLAAD
ncbi:DUF3800 domain-containing protein [Microbacterium sp. KSW4-11]|uniref:DUF3800 domain-containing protein n=1 Tax=Microbacterium gawkjiense TaxID=3067309 RepID=A0ABU3GE50_9MICO|nr:DUF3800 domain-containing protein [Microbacterium sp. KSW4-11]MDT3318087.1 DUF3800 domain-containing protein [Microbacterium sp. KSW4-11]